MPNLKKKTLVEDLSKLLSAASGFIVIEHEKTKHQTLEQLRKQLKTSDVKFKVVKNTLFEKALNLISLPKNLYRDIKRTALPLRRPSAVLIFKGDWNLPLSLFYKFSQHEKTLSFKFGLVDNLFYLAQDLNKIAQLPSKNQLLSQIATSLKAPLTKMIYAFNFNLNKLTIILKFKSKNNF